MSRNSLRFFTTFHTTWFVTTHFPLCRNSLYRNRQTISAL